MCVFVCYSMAFCLTIFMQFSLNAKEWNLKNNSSLKLLPVNTFTKLLIQNWIHSGGSFILCRLLFSGSLLLLLLSNDYVSQPFRPFSSSRLCALERELRCRILVVNFKFFVEKWIEEKIANKLEPSLTLMKYTNTNLFQVIIIHHTWKRRDRRANNVALKEAEAKKSGANKTTEKWKGIKKEATNTKTYENWKANQQRITT